VVVGEHPNENPRFDGPAKSINRYGDYAASGSAADQVFAVLPPKDRRLPILRTVVPADGEQGGFLALAAAGQDGCGKGLPRLAFSTSVPVEGRLRMGHPWPRGCVERR